MAFLAAWLTLILFAPAAHAWHRCLQRDPAYVGNGTLRALTLGAATASGAAAFLTLAVMALRLVFVGVPA